MRFVAAPAARASLAWGVAGALAALALAAWLWGFTVDDALISVRYATSLASGHGYRFNPDGPATDGVTPLAFPFLLAPLALGHAAAWDVLVRSKVAGLLLYVATGAAAGVAIGRAQAQTPWKVVALATLALCVPCAAHAVSGMETALAMALCTAAALAHARPWAAAILAGLAASLRPELLPWAVVLAIGFAGSAAEALEGAILAALPFACCCGVRLVAFGHVAPLSVSAKPSDLTHGLAYTGAAAVAALAPILASAPVALARAPRRFWAIGLAGAVHLGAVAAAGGDWMPFARLVVPIVPSLLIAFVGSAPHARGAWLGARSAAALGLGAYLLARAAPPARHVMTDRAALVRAATPLLAKARVVAALDIGWVSAATEATIVDLGGLTDPEVAALPGGQTSKRVSAAWLASTHPDAVLFYTAATVVDFDAWRDATFPHAVEARLADSSFGDAYAPRAFLPLGTAGSGYLLLAPKDAGAP